MDMQNNQPNSTFSNLTNIYCKEMDPLSSKEAIDNYLKSFPKRELYRLVEKNIPLFIHKIWIKGSINGHLNCVRYLQRKSLDLENKRKKFQQALAWLNQAGNIYDKVIFFKQLPKNQLLDYNQSPSELKHGDVLLSYKTREYLRRSRLSALVKFFSKSHITHAAIVHRKAGKCKILMSGDQTNGIGTISPQPEFGEIFLILRPNQNVDIKKLDDSIEKWLDLVKFSEKTNPINNFPELKVQTASVIGLFYVISMSLFHRPINIKNPFSNRPGVYCSELIDNIYIEAEVYLTPRSFNQSIVGPVEILYSPHLSLIGFMAGPNDRQKIIEEVIYQFISD